MNALEDMQLFATTVEAGSFTAAAERLGLSKQFV
ncbi:MAG TPA: LysR family transcriptional regulator, partial [Plasticicumulans sp.]|nr:LysR family transcriptional regulator [Plasticicumulans sp.]